MMAFLTIASILAAFLATGHCQGVPSVPSDPVPRLICKSCLGLNQKTCKESNTTEIECAEGVTNCATISERCYAAGTVLPAIAKSCLPYPAEMCNSTIIMTAGTEVDLRVNLKCCNSGDNCNTDRYEVPMNNTKNGVVCPYCHEKDPTKKPCVPGSATMKCVGNQHECVTVVVKVRRADHSEINCNFQGCITEGACALGFKALVGTEPIGNYTMTCRKPACSSN